MKIEKDPEVVKRLAEEREDQNWRFRSFMKTLDMGVQQVDEIVQRHFKEVSLLIDCRECGNCCRAILPSLDSADLARLASGMGISEKDLTYRYLSPDEDGSLTFNARPCPLLDGNTCTVYEHRPEACRSYPHLSKYGFVFRLAQAVSNCSVCPIVFNVYERLKADLWHPVNHDEFDPDESEINEE